MSVGSWLLAGSGAYVLAHFMLYVLVLRNVCAFRRERVIFVYHCGSFAILLIGMLLVSVLIPSRNALPGCLSGLAVHAIYSMSFLEAWSLSQISYSIAILDAIETTPNLTREAAGQTFAATGSAKKASRLAALQRLGLIAVVGDRATLTLSGRIAVSALVTLRRIANLRDTG